MTGNNGVRTCLFLIFLQGKNKRKTTTVFCGKRFYEFGMGPNTFLSPKKWQRQLKPNVAIRDWTNHAENIIAKTKLRSKGLRVKFWRRQCDWWKPCLPIWTVFTKFARPAPTKPLRLQQTPPQTRLESSLWTIESQKCPKCWNSSRTIWNKDV